MIKAAPMKECDKKKKDKEEEGVTFHVIREGGKAKCLIWDAKYVVLIDPEFMRTLKEAEKEPHHPCGLDENDKPVAVDLYRTLLPWKNRREALMHFFPDIPLLKQIDDITKEVPKVLPPAIEREKGEEILEKLTKLRDAEKKRKAADEALPKPSDKPKKWKLEREARAKAFDAKRRTEFLELLRKWKARVEVAPNGMRRPGEMRVAGNTRALGGHLLKWHDHPNKTRRVVAV